jgi:hypothetical protein
MAGGEGWNSSLFHPSLACFDAPFSTCKPPPPPKKQRSLLFPTTHFIWNQHKVSWNCVSLVRFFEHLALNILKQINSYRLCPNEFIGTIKYVKLQVQTLICKPLGVASFLIFLLLPWSRVSSVLWCLRGHALAFYLVHSSVCVCAVIDYFHSLQIY